MLDSKLWFAAAVMLPAIMVGVSISCHAAETNVAERSAAAEGTSKFLLIRSKGKVGLIDRSGNLVLEPKYDALSGYDSSYRRRFDEHLETDFSEQVRPAQIAGKWGFIDKKGNEVITPQFAMAGPFRDGWAQVRVGDAWGVIDREGKFVIEPKYSFIGPFRSGLARVAVGGIRLEGGFPRSKWGFINRTGDEIVPPKYEYAHGFSNGRALVNIGGEWRGMSGLSFQGGRWGVIDEVGRFVVEPKIEIGSATSLDETEVETNDDLQPVKYDGKFGYRDKHWNFLIEPQFDKAMPFSEKLAVVLQAGKFGYIDTTGQLAIKPRFNKAAKFSEGLAPVVTANGVRFIDKTGNEILKIEADEARPFDAGLAAVRVGKLWGVIDKRGHYLHKPQFTDIRRYDDFIYIHRSDVHRGIMNREGEIIVEPKYGFIGAFQKNGFAMIDTESMGLPPEFWVIDHKGQLVPGPMLPMDAENRDKNIAFFPKRLNGQWGIVDGNGEFVIPPRFKGIQMLGVGILGVQEGPKWGIVDLESGQLIIEPTYYSISRFSEGLAEARPNPPLGYPPGKGDWVGYIDLSGRLVIPNKFAGGSPFENGIAHVSVLYNGDFDWYYIDKEGRYLWHPDQN